MRKVTFGGASSLDNYLARPDGAVDWLMWSDEAAAFMTNYWKTIDTILMGRKTYEVAIAHDRGKKKGKGKREKDLYGGIKSFVFSRTLKRAEHEGVEIVSADAAEFIRNLKTQE